jgi:hypothetical protein
VVINQINLLKVGQSSSSAAESDKPSWFHRCPAWFVHALAFVWPSMLATGALSTTITP